MIAVSEALADQIRRDGFAPSRVVVVHNGVPAVANVAPRTKPCGRWTLGVVGLLRPRKGVEVLLDALAMLRRQGIDAGLRVVGAFESSRYASEVVGRARHLELGLHVIWTGFTNDVIGELRKMDLLVLPSLFGEGLPMVVLEAMAAGVPVVATRVPGVSEAIRDGRDGVLAAPGNAADLARTIADVVEGRHDWSALRTRTCPARRPFFRWRHGPRRGGRVSRAARRAGERERGLQPIRRCVIIAAIRSLLRRCFPSTS